MPGGGGGVAPRGVPLSRSTYSIDSAAGMADPNGRLGRNRGICAGSPSLGLGRCSAVNGDLCPRDVAALVGEQECHQLRNLLRRSVAVHRHLLHPLLALLGCAERAIMSVSIGPG